jgi:acetyl esterase/lipase
MHPLVITAAAAAVAIAPAGGALPHERTYRPAHRVPVGTIIDIHGGRWLPSSRRLIDTGQVYSKAYAQWGWKVVVPAFHGGRRALGDLRVVLRRELAAAHGAPVCVSGESSGGQLALMLAVNPQVTCAIGLAAPVDLTVRHPNPGDETATIRDARRIWGSRVGAFSPVNVAARTTAAVMLFSAVGDRAAPPARALGYAARAPHATNITMRAGHGSQVTWEHTHVDAAAGRCAAAAMHRMLNAAAHGRRAAYGALGAPRRIC